MSFYGRDNFDFIIMTSCIDGEFYRFFQTQIHDHNIIFPILMLKFADHHWCIGMYIPY